MKRGNVRYCNYAIAASVNEAAQKSTTLRPASADLQSRISDLEDLVVTLMQGRSAPTPLGLETPEPSPSSFGDAVLRTQAFREVRDNSTCQTDTDVLELHRSGLSYIQSGHWEAILGKIRGLKEDLHVDGKVPSGSSLFYDPNRHATREDLLSAMPVRVVTDRLMALHFDSYMLTPCQ